MRAARLLVLAALLALALATAAQARTHGLAYGPNDVAVGLDQKPQPLRVGSKAALRKEVARTLRQGQGLEIGTDRIWPALDDVAGLRLPEDLHAARRREQHRGLGGERLGRGLDRHGVPPGRLPQRPGGRSRTSRSRT